MTRQSEIPKSANSTYEFKIKHNRSLLLIRQAEQCGRGDAGDPVNEQPRSIFPERSTAGQEHRQSEGQLLRRQIQKLPRAVKLERTRPQMSIRTSEIAKHRTFGELQTGKCLQIEKSKDICED